ncbi:MAG: isoleucine--tRNA ligase [Candidatus Woesearchaeota archaeon]|nr:MAG: isoleucine--tRNA ligase [Candidatus Woesearchaeota archaeon]
MASYEPTKVEKEILSFWKKKKVYEKQKKLYAKSKKRWSFTDGPITANNPMGVHHAWGRTLKDIYLRYKAMQRFNIRRQNGFDCQGLWVEVEVEKEKGFKSKEDIEKYGIGKFVIDCRKRVDKMSKRITEQSIRLGQWMDWDNSYYTHLDKANEYKWMFLKDCYKKGWLYKGVDVVPWCPRCSCTVSKHAITTEGYWEEKDDALFMKFPVKGKKNEYFLVFTTTAWTVPADVALAANPNVYYVRAKKGDEVYILAEKLVEPNLGKGVKILDKFLGTDLEGQAYEMPYKDFPAQKKAIISGAKSEDETGSSTYTIVMWDEATEEEGTGIVHIAPGCGPEDYMLGKTERLTAPSPLDERGIYTKGYGWLTGKNYVDGGKLVIEDMKKRGFMYKVEPYTHRYPHCTRCRTGVVFRLVPEWYISMDEIRPKLIAENKKITWIPDKGQKYEENWLKNMGDWLISRKRYWGLPLPIWECDCGHVEVIGSKAELKKKAVEGFGQLKELHKPWVDKVKIKCPKCKKKISRIIDTGDVWLDAGMVPFYSLDWLKDKKYFNNWYPADFVTECGPGQYRCWFYAMILHGVALTGKRPFKIVLTNELVKDEKGEEMHKSLGNAIWFDEAADKVGADVMRWLYSIHDPTTELWFGWNVLKETQRSLNVLWNFGEYIKIYLKLKKKPTKPKQLDIKSKWLLSRIEHLKKEVTDYLDKYQHHLATQAIENFFLNDLSRGYGQWIREELATGNNKEVINYTLYYTLLELLKLMSPLTPFLVERMYQDIFKKLEKKESIHLFEWPKSDSKLISKKLEEEIKIIQDVSSTILAAREKANTPIRWPLAKVSVVSGSKKIKDAVKKHKDMLNYIINSLELDTKRIDNIHYKIKVDYSRIEPKYENEKRLAEIIRVIAQQSPESIVEKLTEKGKFTFKLSNGKKANIVEDDLIIEETLLPTIISGKGDNYSVYLDLRETDEVVAKGFTREITRRIQALRKKANLKKPDKIDLTISAPEDIDVKDIKTKVGAKTLEFGNKSDTEKRKFKDSFKVKGKDISIGFNINIIK